jgi:hypothetical protein
MFTSIYHIVFQWFSRHPLEAVELPNGGFAQSVSGYVRLYDKNGEFVREVQLSEDAVVNLMLENGI